MRWIRLLLVLSAWALATGVALAGAADTAIGPVVLVVTPTHGVHLGDLVIGLAAAAIATVISLLLLLPSSDGPTSRQ